MKRDTIKRVLFSLASLGSIPALAQTINMSELTLVEKLPIQQRAIIHAEIAKFLMNNPDLAEEAKVVAVDREGMVYVLDEKMVKIVMCGNPSCATAE